MKKIILLAFKKTSLMASISMGALMTFAPTPAMAWCHPCLMDAQIAASDVAAKVATLAQMAASQASTLAGIAQSTLMTMNAEQGTTASIVASREKELAAESELVQAELNYDAASEAQKRFAEAQDNFTAPSAKAYRVCEVMKAGDAAKKVGDDARSIGKALSDASGNRQMYTENASASAKKVLDNYRKNYCSIEDEKRGRCTAVEKSMQNAAVSADSLMSPTSGETFTAKEKVAAVDFIQMVTNPTPQEMLPKGLEKKSAAAERFNLAQMSAQAQMSMADHSLMQILASKTATGTTPEKSISVVGMMKKFSEEKFGNPVYVKGLGGMDSPGLLKEINSQMAVRNWISYHGYLQNERVEALLATQLAIAVKESSDGAIASARSMVTR